MGTCPMLGIRVWLDGENVNVTRTIEPELQVCIAHTSSEGHVHNNTLPFSLKITTGVVK